MNEKPEIKVGKLPVITKFIYTLGVLPTSYLMSMTYQEQVTWLYNYLQTQVIPAINTDVEAVQELQNLYELLRTYVNDYFDNLDVQEEINNKLEEMAESGQLTDIIAQYLGLAGMITFNTVSEMKQADNLVNGSKCYTLGYYEVNDGGSACYKIRTVTNNDNVNEMNIISLLNPLLIAELINDTNVYIKQLGAKGDDINDDSNYLRFATNNYDNVILNEGIYKINSNILVSNITNIEGNNKATLHFTSGNENISPNTDGKVNLKNVKINSESGTCYHINRENIKNSIIENNNIKSNSYSILVNANSNGGQDLFISKNKIETNSDGIEINTTSDSDNKFKNTIITDNIISITGGSGSSSGFGIGVADGKNVVISNNIIDEARLEAIHIEDTSKNILINGNILTNCHQNGMRLYGITNEIDRFIASNNKIKGDKSSGYAGIILPSASTGAIQEISLENNVIENFDIGISAYRDINVNNSIIINCNTAFNPSIRRMKGNLTLIDTPILANFTNDEFTEIDSIEVFNSNSLDIDNFITSTNNAKLIKINHLSFKIILPITSTSDSRIMRFMKLPTYLDAIIKTDIKTGGANKGKGVAHTTYNSTDGLVNKVLSVAHSGTFSSSANIIIDGNYLAVQPSNPNQSSGNMTLEIEIEGTILIKGAY